MVVYAGVNGPDKNRIDSVLVSRKEAEKDEIRFDKVLILNSLLKALTEILIFSM